MKNKIIILTLIGAAVYLAKKKERLTMINYIDKADIIIHNLEKKMENQCTQSNTSNTTKKKSSQY